METAYSSLIDVTTFGIVRRHLRAAHSPITGVIFVARRDLLPRVAAMLDAPDEQSSELNQRLLQRWFRDGQLIPGSMCAGEAETMDLSAIEDEACCEVIFLPPYYLVWLAERRAKRRVHFEASNPTW
ncbi:MAG: hypothetical protein L0Z50_23940 [Verrucomicrobiales bacterium]|nr:hypothetical protein [Verrucomicrobiales bacterium]